MPNLQLTEFDIDTADEMRQADFMRDVLTIAFSHPAVTGIVMWQVWGQGAGQKALWRADWTVKPAGQMWMDKVYKEWWTEITGKSAADGTFKARGFHGEYLITTRVENQTRTARTHVDGDAALDFNF